MNQPNYTCPKCGNTSAFNELVWEQRRYPIDHHGETIGVSEAVEETEVPIQISCARCGAIINRMQFSCVRGETQLSNCHRNSAEVTLSGAKEAS